METTKICTKCKLEKSTKQFYKRKDTKDGLRSHCKECIRIKFESNKDEIYKKRKASYDLRRDDINRKRRIEYLENIEYYRELDRKRSQKKYRLEYKRNHSKLYRQTEKGKIVDRNNKHRRRLKVKEGTLTSKELSSIISSAKNCYWCNTPIKNDYHVDHYIPLSKGGTHTADNIVIACPKCNLEKHAKDPYEFAQTKGKLL